MEDNTLFQLRHVVYAAKEHLDKGQTEECKAALGVIDAILTYHETLAMHKGITQP